MRTHLRGFVGWVLVAVSATACTGILGIQEFPEDVADGGDASSSGSNHDGSIVVVVEGGDTGSSHDATMTDTGHSSGSSSGSDASSSSGSDSGGGCVIGGTSYASGAPNPANGCQTCQPGVSASAWSQAADGITCGAGEVCHTGVCGTGCEIAGVYYAAATANPNNGCQSCTPATSTSMWSNVTDGTGCGNGQVCSAGACGTQCDIGGTVYASGAPNPASACQSCQPGTSTTAWTNLAPGTSCGSGSVCNGTTCAAGCYVGGTFVAAGPNPANVCQACAPATSTTAWTSTDGVNAACPSGQVCNGSPAACAAGCWVGGAYYAPNATANSGCEICTPGTSVSSWTNVSGAASCTSGEVCNGGSCTAGCSIGGAFYASGATTNSGCESCVPATSTTQWTNASNGMTCGNGQICSGGACGTQCDIGGTVYSSGAVNPSNNCQSCQPGSSTSTWTNVTDGTTCGSGEVCNTGACKQCAPSQTNPVACGNCGTDTQTCSASGTWQGATCVGQGCTPNANQTCNQYGSQTCTASCGWGTCSCPQTPVCTPGEMECAGSGGNAVCNSCGQWGNSAVCPSPSSGPGYGTCQNGVCGLTCTRTVTGVLNVTSPFSFVASINYNIAAGGGGGSGTVNGGGGGGGGSSAILAGGTFSYAAQGGSAGFNGAAGSAGYVTSGQFQLQPGENLTVYVGGGGGAGGTTGAVGGGGGGGAGYFGGGGGAGSGYPGLYAGGGGGSAGGAEGQSELTNNDGTAGSSLMGGNGGSNASAGGGGGSGAGTAGEGGSNAGGGGGGGAFGSGGGGGGNTAAGAAGGANGNNGAGGLGGQGALQWANATVMPMGVGAGGATLIGGSAGLVILTYWNPGPGPCPL